MSRGNEVSLTLPAGEYYIGDPCYVIADDRWDEVCNQMFPGVPGNDDYENHDIQLDGTHFFVYSTAYGDGLYDDGMYTYGVDAGCIGAVPMSLVNKREQQEIESNGLGRFVKTDTPLQCSRNDEGTFTFIGSFGIIEIITDGSEYEDEEDFDDEDYEDQDYSED